MKDKLIKKIDEISKDKSLCNCDEASIKHGVILYILSLLGWDTFNVEEVVPEHSVETKKIDFSLRINEINKVFIEVKRPSKDLDKHQKQLLDYSFREGVKLAVLTNGLIWWFYLPLNEGSWKNRQFYTADLREQGSEAISNIFLDLLSKENVVSGDSLKNAEDLYKSQMKEEIIDKNLPKAWRRLISGQDDGHALLVDLIIETTEKISGFRPEINKVEDFLKNGSHSTNLNAETPIKTESYPEFKKASNLSPKSKDVGYEIMKMGMRLLKETNGDISDKDAVNELLKAFPKKTPESLKTEMGKLRQNYNLIVNNKRSKEGTVSQIIDQLKSGEKATAGISDSTNKYTTRAWHAFHEV